MQHLLAFNPTTHQIAWATKYDAPGIAGWQSIVLTAITITAAAISQGAEAGYSWRGDYNSAYSENGRYLGLMSAYQQAMSKKYSAAKQAGNVYYVLTTVKDKDDKGSGLVGVSLYTGQPVNQIVFHDKEPDYEVDDAAGRMFNMNKGEIAAYQIVDKAEAAPVGDKDK